MARPLRYLPPDCPLVEVTCRTIHGRLLLRPSRELNRRILGVLARAARRNQLGVCAFIYLSVKMLEAGYRTYRDSYRDAVQKLRETRSPVRFPRYGIPPPPALPTPTA